MDLYKHQKKIIDEDPKKYGLFWGTGTGKTLTSLCLAKGKTLIITTKTVRDAGNFQDTIKKYNLNLDATIISKEDFKKYKNTFLKENFQTVILDEVHTMLGVLPETKYKNKVEIPKTSQIFEDLYGFIKTIKPERIYALSATITKSPMTIWAVANILGFNWNFFDFRSAFYSSFSLGYRKVFKPYKNKEKEDRLIKAVHKLGSTIKLENCVDLPPQIFRDIIIPLNSNQKKKIKEIKIDYPDPISQFQKKHQIENGFLKRSEYESETLSIKSEKEEIIKDLALQHKKIVIFCKFTFQIKTLQKILSRKYNVFVLNGETKDRGKMLERCNRMEDYIFIAQSQISAGWELPNCSCMIFASLNYSFVDYEQAVGRINRINNPKTNLYIHLITNEKSADKAIYDNVKNKKDFSEKIYCEEL